MGDQVVRKGVTKGSLYAIAICDFTMPIFPQRQL